MTSAAGSRPPEHPFERAKRLARELHQPVYVAGDAVSREKPRGPHATAWPNGTITVGDPEAAARDIARKLVPPAA